MAISSSPSTLLCLLLLLRLGIIWAAATPHPIRDKTSVTLPPLSQLRNIIDAIIGTGDFAGWFDTVADADPTLFFFPPSFTIFMPTDTALSHLSSQSLNDPTLLRYHIVPQKLSFLDLLQLKTGDRLPTLLTKESILVTNNTRSNFMVDGCPISQPDLYSRDAVAVHEVESVLDFSVYGSPSASSATLSAPPRQASPGFYSSDAPLQRSKFRVGVSAIFAIFAFKIQWNSIALEI